MSIVKRGTGRTARWQVRLNRNTYTVGTYTTEREAKQAEAEAKVNKPWEATPPSAMTCDELADEYLTEYEGHHKASSYSTAVQSLRRFRAEFGSRPVASIERAEAKAWAKRVPPSAVPKVVALFNHAVDLELIERSPFRAPLGVTHGRGRADQAPPTVEELDRLLSACDALGEYAEQMRALVEFASYTLMRPGELYELRWRDIDFARNRITVSRRLYRGRVDTPKNGRTKVIALVPPAHAVLLRLAQGAGDDLVFASKWGKRLTAPTVTQYWKIVCASAHLDFDFYHATKHLGVHRLWTLGLSARGIAAQAGWSERDAEAMLRVYGHTDLSALAEVDALYANLNDAPVTQAVSNPLS